MIINKETYPYRMGLSPLYFLPPSSVNVTNERLGYFPITPPYHHQYDYVLPSAGTMQSPVRQTATSSSSPTSSSSSSSAGMLGSIDNGQSLYFYMNAAGKEEITSVPLSPPHTPPLLYTAATNDGDSILAGNDTRGSDTASDAVADRYGLSNLSAANGGNGNLGGSNAGYGQRNHNNDGGSASDSSGNNDGRLYPARNSVIMKVENQQVVPLLGEEGSHSIEQFVCKWENCYW